MPGRPNRGAKKISRPRRKRRGTEVPAISDALLMPAAAAAMESRTVPLVGFPRQFGLSSRLRTRVGAPNPIRRERPRRVHSPRRGRLVERSRFAPLFSCCSYAPLVHRLTATDRLRSTNVTGVSAPVSLFCHPVSPFQPPARSSCSIAFSRFPRARSMALASLGVILPVVISVSILD
jgi:hypothetical protein